MGGRAGGGDIDLSLSLWELLIRASVYVGMAGVLVLEEYSETEDHLLLSAVSRATVEALCLAAI